MQNIGSTIINPIAGDLTASYTGTAGSTTAMPVDTRAVLVHVTTDAYVCVGTTATTSNATWCSAKIPYIFPAQKGAIVSAIQDAAGGTLHVSPLG